jgi:hypothetical protein
MRGVCDPGGISANGTDASTSTPSKRTSRDTISRMSSLIEPTTTGVPIPDATKAFREQIIANDMLQSTAEGDNEFPNSNGFHMEDLGLDSFYLDRLEDFSLFSPAVELIHYDVCLVNSPPTDMPNQYFRSLLEIRE